MPTLSLYGGPLKATIVERAFGMCGQSAVTGELLTPEEYALGVLAMNDVASSMPSAFTYNMPVHGPGEASDECGIVASDVLGFTAMVAQELAQVIGKEFRASAVQVSAMSALRGKYLVVPLVEMRRQTIRGAGNQRWFGPYFLAGTSDAETAQ